MKELHRSALLVRIGSQHLPEYPMRIIVPKAKMRSQLSDGLAYLRAKLSRKIDLRKQSNKSLDFKYMNGLF